MSYLVTQMFLYLCCAFALGVALGWVIWGQEPDEDAQRTVLRSVLTTSEVWELEEAFDAKLIAGIPKIRIQVELGVL